MSKLSYFTRYTLIISKLRKGPATFLELSNYLQRETELRGDQQKISDRTFLRDRAEILSLFGINIEFDHSPKTYSIVSDAQPEISARMLETFEMFNALNTTDNLSQFVYFDRRRAIGSEHFYALLHAIKNKLKIKFSYYKFWEDEPSQRVVEPYALKEFKNRWYILANDTKVNQIRTFGLDRLTNLEITRQKFEVPKTYDAEKSFQYCFGIIAPDNEKPQEIELSFDPFQGKYIKTLPLHETQEILIDNEDELRIKLTLYITDDLIMELLSYSDSMMVLKPKSLARKIKDAHKKAFSQY